MPTTDRFADAGVGATGTAATTRTRLKYPDAAIKEQHYLNLESKLLGYQSTIIAKCNTASSIVKSALFLPKSYGYYRDSHDDAYQRWVKQQQAIITELQTFASSLNSCIVAARNSATVWRSRIGVTEEY